MYMTYYYHPIISFFIYIILHTYIYIIKNFYYLSEETLPHRLETWRASKCLPLRISSM